jgi:hypothetical protein
MYNSTSCITSRHHWCSDAACRCRCHQRADGTNQGPDRTAGKLTPLATILAETLVKQEYNASTRPIDREASGREEIDSGAIGPADLARLSDPSLHDCAYCGKPTDKRFTICCDCFDKHEKGKTAEERREQRAGR